VGRRDAEVIARVSNEGFGLLDVPPQRLNAKDTPVPFHPNLWAAHRPTVRSVVQRQEIFYECEMKTPKKLEIQSCSLQRNSKSKHQSCLALGDDSDLEPDVWSFPGAWGLELGTF